MFGSVSYLSRIGTSTYAKDWTDISALSVVTWHGARICPMIPLIPSECVGSVVRELNELSLWLEEIYNSDPQGLHEVWWGLVGSGGGDGQLLHWHHIAGRYGILQGLGTWFPAVQNTE
jgi:hypothetical protein